jgi:hypothetical protein
MSGSIMGRIQHVVALGMQAEHSKLTRNARNDAGVFIGAVSSDLR